MKLSRNKNCPNGSDGANFKTIIRGVQKKMEMIQFTVSAG